jgi:hypothetical protein
MKIHPSLENALNKIDFVSRYKKLREEFPFSDESFAGYSNEMVHSIIADLGYDSQYNKKENFFGIKEKQQEFDFQFNLSFKAGVVELIWGVKRLSKQLTIGGPWRVICDLLLQKESGIKKPAFRNYEDLKQILTKAFRVYEDFKKELINGNN